MTPDHDTIPPPACNQHHVLDVDGSATWLYCQLIEGHTGSHRAAHDGAAVGWVDDDKQWRAPLIPGLAEELGAAAARMQADEADDGPRTLTCLAPGELRDLFDVEGGWPEAGEAGTETQPLVATFLARLRTAHIHTREAARALTVTERDRILGVAAWCGIEDGAWKAALDSLVFKGRGAASPAPSTTDSATAPTRPGTTAGADGATSGPTTPTPSTRASWPRR